MVLFHFAHDNLPGGFLGVDIFFVLSGYLITQIIHGEILAGRFTVRGFYERRVRRIVPALLVLLAFCAAVALLIMLPSDLMRFGQALLATLGFVANIYAWSDTNYFAPLAEQKPLLHMWSLGVEEQFYIFFPLLLWLLARRWPRLTLTTIVAITVGSFALNALMIEWRFTSAAFFLLPPRAWELGVGAVLALAPRGAPEPEPGGTVRFPVARALAGLLGLGLIVAALFAPYVLDSYLSGMTFAVLGTATLLWLGQRGGSPVARLLSFPPLVWVGLMSYSLYLWHWPVIVFSKYYLVRELRPMEIAAAWAFMLVAAWLSWRFVERPFRSRGYPVRRLYAGAAIGSALLALVALGLLQFNGLPGRLNAAAARMNESVNTHYHCGITDRLDLGKVNGCAMNLPSGNTRDARVVLIGNSHAQMYAPVWREILAQRNLPGLLIPMTGCLPTVSTNFDLECIALARTNLEAVKALPKVDTVVIAMSWWHGPLDLVDSSGRTVDNADKAGIVAGLDDLIAQLRASGRRVVLVGPIATPGWNVASEVSRQLAYGRKVQRALGEPRAKFMFEFGTALGHFTNRSDVAFARPDLIQCDDQTCWFVIDGRALFSDENHLARGELGRFRGIFTQAFDR